jgi:hypothetical protein
MARSELRQIRESKRASPDARASPFACLRRSSLMLLSSCFVLCPWHSLFEGRFSISPLLHVPWTALFLDIPFEPFVQPLAVYRGSARICTSILICWTALRFEPSMKPRALLEAFPFVPVSLIDAVSRSYQQLLVAIVARGHTIRIVVVRRHRHKKARNHDIRVEFRCVPWQRW